MFPRLCQWQPRTSPTPFKTPITLRLLNPNCFHLPEMRWSAHTVNTLLQLHYTHQEKRWEGRLRWSQEDRGKEMEMRETKTVEDERRQEYEEVSRGKKDEVNERREQLSRADIKRWRGNFQSSGSERKGEQRAKRDGWSEEEEERSMMEERWREGGGKTEYGEE